MIPAAAEAGKVGWVFIVDRRTGKLIRKSDPYVMMSKNMFSTPTRHYWWKEIPIAANWKVAQEAFFEGYHVPATHPQLEPKAVEFIFGEQAGRDVQFAHWNVEYDAFPRGHGRFYGKKTPMAGNVQAQNGDSVAAMAARLKLLADGMDAQVLQGDIDVLLTLKGKQLQAGSSLGGEYVKALYARAAAEKRPMPAPTPGNLGMWGGEIFIFPNFLILPQSGKPAFFGIWTSSR